MKKVNFQKIKEDILNHFSNFKSKLEELLTNLDVLDFIVIAMTLVCILIHIINGFCFALYSAIGVLVLGYIERKGL